jgi:hypothetical protein
MCACVDKLIYRCDLSVNVWFSCVFNFLYDAILHMNMHCKCFFNTVGVFSYNIYNQKNIRHKEIYIQKNCMLFWWIMVFFLLNMNMNQWVERCLYQYAFDSFFLYIVNRYPINKVILKVTTYDLGKQLSCSFNHFYL